MPSYSAPGVYIQDVVSGSQSIDQVASSVGVLIGVTRNGVIGVAQKVNSWTEFVSKYASGLDTPFTANSYLPYAVYGFFQNGGKELYVVSVKKNDAVKASATGSTCAITVTASSEGAWGNSIKVQLVKSSDWSANNKSFDVTVSVGTVDSVTIRDCYIDNIVESLMANYVVASWIGSVSLNEVTDLAEDTITLANGSDGGALADADYISALSAVDFLDDATLIAIPGQTSSALNTALLSYCDEHEKFPIIDMPVGSTVDATRTYRKTINAFTGALCYPWGKINDPLTGSLKLVPTVGHVMGVYSRTIEERGVFKAPAGTDAVVNGFVELETLMSSVDVGTLNSLGVVCIVSKPNSGIVIWGARSLNSVDNTMRYVSDGLLNLNIKKSLYVGTQFAVFEPNDKNLWSRVNTACKAFLETLRQQGALKGEAYEAYYVTVDDSNNTPATIQAGQLNIEIGYAPVRPAEFVVIKLAHSIDSDSE